jgi:hypothetical protein
MLEQTRLFQQSGELQKVVDKDDTLRMLQYFQVRASSLTYEAWKDT